MKKEKKEFQQLARKIYILTALMFLAVAVTVYAIYSYVLHGRFANFVLAVFQYICGIGEAHAVSLYQRIFRSHMDQWMLLLIITVAVVFLRIYVNQLIRYFLEISQGMDVLLQEHRQNIVLSPELSVVERKMNLVKQAALQRNHTILAAEQRKNDLVMYLAHDLKTPLASVISYLSLLRDEKEISEELRDKYLMISLKKAERLEELIYEFFEIAKFSLSDITLHCTKVNLTRLLEQLVFESGPVLDQKGLTCRVDMAEDLLVCCDADKMQRVFENLLRNAVIYSFEGSQITIAADSQGDSLVVRFINRGDTIPQERLERIFEQFYRLDTGRNTGGGSGLGLAIARRIVELHQGRISAVSEEGVTTFTVVMPGILEKRKCAGNPCQTKEGILKDESIDE